MKSVFVYLLNSLKNSQYINLIVFAILYMAIFVIIVLGFLFKSSPEYASNLIVNIAEYFFNIDSDANISFQINGSALISYYLLALYILGLIQETIIYYTKISFNKDWRDAIEKAKTRSFLIFTSTILVLELFASIYLQEWWMCFIAIASYTFLLFLFFWYWFIVKIINRIIGILK